MVNLDTAVTLVVNHIVQLGLYSFKSLGEETQDKLTNTYGKDFGKKVDAQLSL